MILAVLPAAPRAQIAHEGAAIPEAPPAADPTRSTGDPSAPISALTINAVGDGVTDNADAFTAMFADTQPDTYYFPPGTYRLSCDHHYLAAAPISLLGSARDATTIRYDRGCVGTEDLFRWDGQSNVKVEHLTIDLNYPAAAPAIYSVLASRAFSRPTKGFTVNDVAIVNGTSPVWLISVSPNGSNTFSDPVITNNHLSLASAGTNQNQCLALGVWWGSTPEARITGAVVKNNVCVNTGMQIDGSNGLVEDNDISGFAFGTGIFMVFDDGSHVSKTVPTTDHDNVIAYNIVHDSPPGLDVNQSPAGGIENNCYRCLIIGNVMHHLGGEGIRNFGERATIIGNVAYDNGKGGAAGALPAGFYIRASSLGKPYLSKSVFMSGNVAYDDGARTQWYGYADDANIDGPVTLRANRFDGTTRAIYQRSPKKTVDSD